MAVFLRLPSRSICGRSRPVVYDLSFSGRYHSEHNQPLAFSIHGDAVASSHFDLHIAVRVERIVSCARHRVKSEIESLSSHDLPNGTDKVTIWGELTVWIQLLKLANCSINRCYGRRESNSPARDGLRRHAFRACSKMAKTIHPSLPACGSIPGPERRAKLTVRSSRYQIRIVLLAKQAAAWEERRTRAALPTRTASRYPPRSSSAFRRAPRPISRRPARACAPSAPPSSARSYRS